MSISPSTMTEYYAGNIFCTFVTAGNNNFLNTFCRSSTFVTANPETYCTSFTSNLLATSVGNTTSRVFQPLCQKSYAQALVNSHR